RSREHAVADAERTFAPTFDNPELGRWSLGVPLLGHRADLTAVVHLDHAQHCHLGYAASLMESASRRAVDQSLVGHVLEEPLEVDLLLTGKPERPSDLALRRRLVGRGD